MLTRLTFYVEGHLLMESRRSFRFNDDKYELEVDERGFLAKISVTTKVSINSVLQISNPPQSGGV